MFARTFRLGLERLDDRNAPSSLAGNAVATTDWMSTPAGDSLPGYSLSEYDDPTNNPVNQKPVITNFSVAVESGSIGRFTGKVVDENPAGLTVTLTGPQGCLTASGQTVTTDSEGNFEFVGLLTAVVDTGMVLADTADAQAVPADQASFLLTV